ncbi:MAG: hypothetical protein PHR28_12375, partial [candidate division Zixibacteria bacterium]|nr:hypothetical protein [candidate division Zixibacteria bacterium]
ADLSDAAISDDEIMLPLAPAAARAAFDTVKLFGMRNGGHDTLLHAKQTVSSDALTLSGKFARFRQFRLAFKREGVSYPSMYLSRPNDSSVPAAANPGVFFKIIDDGLLFTVQTAAGGIDRLTGIIATDQGIDTLAYRQVAHGSFAGYYRPAADVEFIDRIIIDGPRPWVPDTVVLGLHHLTAGQPARFDHDDDLTIDCGANDLFGDALVTIVDTALPPPPSSSFIRRPFAFLPGWLAFANPMRLAIRFSTLPDTVKTAFYIHRAGNRWSWVGRRVDLDNNRLTATVSGGGAYAVLTDTTAPTISDLNIADKQTLTSGRPQIRCSVADDLSGFEDDRNFEITIDGKWVIPEYDSDQKLLTGKPHWTIRGTSHLLKITVRDRCGNATTVARTFHVVAKTGP